MQGDDLLRYNHLVQQHPINIKTSITQVCIHVSYKCTHKYDTCVHTTIIQLYTQVRIIQMCTQVSYKCAHKYDTSVHTHKYDTSVHTSIIHVCTQVSYKCAHKYHRSVHVSIIQMHIQVHALYKSTGTFTKVHTII